MSEISLGAPGLDLEIWETYDPAMSGAPRFDFETSESILLSISFALLALTACRPHDFPQFAPNYREYAYVTNGGSGTVSVYDVVNVRVDRELPVGQNPTAVTASATRNEVYVVNSGTRSGQGSVSVINAENNSVVGNIPVHKLPVAIDLAPAGDLAYVANSGSNTISVIDLKIAPRSRSDRRRRGASRPPRRSQRKSRRSRKPCRQLRQHHRSRHTQGAHRCRRMPRRQRHRHSARLLQGLRGLRW